MNPIIDNDNNQPNSIRSYSSLSLKTKPDRNFDSGFIKTKMDQIGETAKQIAENVDSLLPVGHCLLTNEEIQKNSVLDTLEMKELPQLTQRCFAETQEEGVKRMTSIFLGGGLVSGSKVDKFKMEGGHFSLNFKIWEVLLENLVDKVSPDEKIELKKILSGIKQLLKVSIEFEDRIRNTTLKRSLEDCEIELVKLATEYTNQIQELKPGESFILPGGWTHYWSGEGHALIYEFKRNENGTFDLFFQTSTALPLIDQYSAGDKLRLQPFVRYTNIPEAVICFNEDGTVRPPFIQHILEPDIIDRWSRGQQEPNQDTILKIFKHLENYRVSVPYEESDLITGQRAGTCVPQSTKTWIRRQCSSKLLYKQIIFQCELRMLVAAYRNLEKELREDTQQAALSRNILKQAAYNSLRQVAKAINREKGEGVIIDADLARAANATAYDILQRIAFAEDEIKQKRLTTKAQTDISPFDPSNQCSDRCEARGKIKPTLLIEDVQESANPIQMYSDINISKASDLTEALEKLKSNINKYKSDTKYSHDHCRNIIALEINHIVDQLPIPKCEMNNHEQWIEKLNDTFWNNLTRKEAEEAIGAIYELANLFREFPAEDEPTRTFANALTFQVLTHLLAIKIDNFNHPDPEPSRLENFKVPNPGKLIEGFNYLIFIDRNEFIRVRDAIEYFNKFNDHAKEETIFPNENDTEVEKYEVKERPKNEYGLPKTIGNGKFWESLLDSQEELRNDVRNQAIKDGDQSLALSSNMTLLLEQGVLANKGNPLNTESYRYILYLRNILSWSDDWIKGFSPRDLQAALDNLKNVEKVKTLDMPPMRELSINRQQNRNLSEEHKAKFPLLSDNRSNTSQSDEANLQFTGRKVGKKEKQTAEFNLLNAQPKYDGLVDKLMRTTSEWKLTPHQIIFESSSEIDLFRDPSLQSLFFRLFLRAPLSKMDSDSVSETKSHLGTGELILNDPSLIDISLQFIDKGIKHFTTKQTNEEIQGVRFFLELSFYLYKYLVDAGRNEDAEKFSQISCINHLLQTSNLNPVDKSTLHAYRLLFLSMKLDTLSDEEIIESYQSRSISKMYIDGNMWKNDLLERIQNNFMYKLGSKIQNRLSIDQSFRNTFGMRVLSARLPEKSFHKWVYDDALPNFISAVEVNDDKCKIDLLTGIIYTNQGSISKQSNTYPFELEPTFRRLFGNRNFEYEPLGKNVFTFEHPSFGKMKISEINHRFVYERQFEGEDGLWFELSDTPLNKVPTAFEDDHLYWIPKSNQIKFQDGRVVTGYYTSLKDQKRCFASLDDGRLITVDSNSGLPKEQIEYIDLLHLKIKESENENNKRNFEGLLNIETGSQILVRYDELNRPKKISYNRLISLDGNPLEFDVDRNNRLIWTENSQYIVSSEVPKGYLGTIDNYLLLEPKSSNDKSKILVPFQPIANEMKPIPEGKIDISNRIPLTTPKNSVLLAEQKGRYNYFTYDLVNGDIKPTSTEAQLYLAYIYLSQKEYDRASDLIRKVNKNTSLSADSYKILELIIKYKTGEDHPNGNAIKLLALSLKIKQMEMRSTTPITYDLKNNEDDKFLVIYLESAYKYISSMNNVSLGCRLTEKEEIRVFGELKNQAYLLLDFLKGQDDLTRRCCYYDDLERLVNTYLTSILLRNNYLDDKIESRGPVIQIKANTTNQTSWYDSNVYNDEKLSLYFIKERYIRGKNESEDIKKVNEFLRNPEPEDMRLISSGFQNGHWFSFIPGTIYLSAYKIAKTGTPSERKAMMYKLIQLGEITHNNFKRMIHSSILFLLHVLRYPERYELDPINLNNASDNEVYEFFKTITNTYSTNLSDPKDYASFVSTVESQTVNQPVKTPLKTIIVPEKSDFDITDISSDEIGSKKVEINVDLSHDQSRWDTISGWRKEYLEELPKQASNVHDFELRFQPEMIKAGEENYTEALTNDLASLQAELESGKRQVEEEKQFTISQSNALTLKEEVAKKIKELEVSIRRKKQNLINEVNKHSNEPDIREYQIAKVGGQVATVLNYHDCVEMLLSTDAREYQRRNPNIDTLDINTLAKMTLEIEDLKSYKKQLKRISSLTEKICSFPDNTNDQTRNYLCQTLVNELEAKYHFEQFNEEDQVALRVFSGQSGMIPQLKQINLIAEMMQLKQNDPDKFQDIVIQLIMGGGKTSVIATVILYLTARKENKLAAFVVPQALFNTVAVNTEASMKKAFGKGITTIQFSREDLTTYRMKQMSNAIYEAKSSHEPLVITASSCQCLELELLSQARELKLLLKQKEKLVAKQDRIEKSITEIDQLLNIPNSNIDQKNNINEELQQLRVLEDNLKNTLEPLNQGIEEIKSKIELLSELNQIIKGDALLDEVDMILDCLQEVNFPSGESNRINSSHNNILRAIFNTLIDDTIKVPTVSNQPTVSDFVGLIKNEQTLLDSKDFIKHIAPIIAEILGKQIKEIRDHVVGFEESYIRYASGRIPAQLQIFADSPPTDFTKENLEKALKDWDKIGSFEEFEKDVQFLKHLKSLYASNNKGKEAANLMALSAHALCELLPATLANSGRRNYGISNDPNSSSIVPYLAVNTPATTQFGYYLEEACYYYQWAAAFNIRENELKNLAESAEAAAQYYMDRNDEIYEETPEYKQFKQMFGIGLDEVSKPERVVYALELLSKDPQKRLDITYELVSLNVLSSPERLSSNGMNLLNQFTSRRAMSGTPWNVEGYLKSLVDRYKNDAGTEGKVLYTLAKRAKEGKIHGTEFNTIDEFLDQTLLNNPNRTKVRGIIEAGGIFKKFKDNASVAKSIMDYIDQHNISSEIEGVLFFHKATTAEGFDEAGPSDTLYVWKKGATKPERVGGSSVETLKAKGLDPSRYFVYYDERHTTGVDILQMPDAINLFTFDEKMIRRTVGQGIMRLRKFLYSQNVEIVVQNSTLPKLWQEGRRAEDLIISAEKNQAIRKTRDMERYFRQQIDSIFRNHIVNDLVKSSSEINEDSEYARKVESYEPFFVTSMKVEPYLAHGRLKKEVDTKQMLISLLESKFEDFKKVITDPNITADVAKEVEELKEHILSTTSLPKVTMGLTSSIGMQQTVEIQTQTQVQTQAEVETELELKSYNLVSNTEAREETKIKEEDLLRWILDLKSNVNIEDPIRLQAQLKKFNYGTIDEPLKYENVFSESIYGTNQFFYSCKGQKVIPVFNRLQRPGKQILAIETEQGFKWLMLSQHEANAVKKHLIKLYRENNPLMKKVWLIQPDGTLLVSHAAHERFPLENEGVKRGLLEINAFNGNVDYLDRHTSEFEPWLHNHPSLKIRFLKLRTARDMKNKEILRNNSMVKKSEKSSDNHQEMHKFKARIDVERIYTS